MPLLLPRCWQPCASGTAARLTTSHPSMASHATRQQFVPTVLFRMGLFLDPPVANTRHVSLSLL